MLSESLAAQVRQYHCRKELSSFQPRRVGEVDRKPIGTLANYSQERLGDLFWCACDRAIFHRAHTWLCFHPLKIPLRFRDQNTSANDLLNFAVVTAHCITMLLQDRLLVSQRLGVCERVVPPIGVLRHYP